MGSDGSSNSFFDKVKDDLDKLYEDFKKTRIYSTIVAVTGTIVSFILNILHVISIPSLWIILIIILLAYFAYRYYRKKKYEKDKKALEDKAMYNNKKWIQ